MPSNVRMKNLKVSLENDKLIITGQVTKPFRLTVPVDVVSVDGRLYAIPREFSTFGPIDVNKFVDIVGPDVRPSVEYTRLASGLYVPKGYVSEDVLKKLEELDNEYWMKKFLDYVDLTDGYKNFEEFKFFSLERWDTAFEQAKLLIEELQRRGFKLELWQNEIQVFGPDGEKGYFILPSSKVEHLLRAKWSLLGAAVYTAQKRRPKDTLDLLGQDKPKNSWYKESGAVECDASLINQGGEDVFECSKGGLAIPARPVSPFPNHPYIVKCLKIDRELCLALSYAPKHNSTNPVCQSFGILRQHTFKRYRYFVEICMYCGTLLDDWAHESEDQVDVVSVDGKPKLVSKSQVSDMIDVGPMVATITDVRPSVEYTRLASGLYVPKGYVSEDVLKKLVSTADVKEQAKLLVNELEAKGFKFNYTVVGRPPVLHNVEVVGPDGDKGLLSRWDDRFNQKSSEEYKGKWSLLGVAVLASSQP